MNLEKVLDYSLLESSMSSALHFAALRFSPEPDPH